MKKMLPILTSLLFAGGIAFAQDTVVLKNGDTLTGKVLKQDAQHVFFRSSAFGSVSLATRDITEIRIATDGLGELEGLGALKVPAEAMTQEKEQPDRVVSPQMARKNPTPPPQAKDEKEKPKQWAGQAGLAIAMRESNTLRRSGNTVKEKNESFESYRVYGNVNWKSSSNRNSLRWDWTYRYSRSDVRLNDDYLNLTQNYKHTFKDDNYFASAKTVYMRDYRRQILDEFLQTAEMGVKLFNRAKLQFSTSVGGGYHTYNREIYNSSTDQAQEMNVSEPTLVFEESLRWQVVNSLTLLQKYSHLGDFKNYQFVFSTGLENKLIRDLFLRLEYRIDRDTEVSYDDKGYYDKALLTSVLYKF